MTTDPAAGRSVRGDRTEELTVTGGRGGIAAALDDLVGVVGVLRGGADTVGAAAFSVHRLDLWSAAAVRSGVDTAVLVARVEWCRSGVVGLLRDLAGELDTLAWRTMLAVRAYRQAELEAAAMTALARGAVVAVARSAQGGGARLGLLHDGTPAAAEAVPVEAESRVVVHDLASVVTSQSLLSGRPVVRVIEVEQPDGSGAWIVQVPGTQVWHPRAGPVPHDLTADVRLMGLQEAVLATATLDALTQAQAATGRATATEEPVMLTGHSLGGIAVMVLAADDRVRARANITHVLTAGSPVGHVPVPAQVQVLSFEHVGDVVPLVDLTPNPDLPHWTTVRRDVPGARMFAPGTGPPEHSAVTYRETARLAAGAAADGSHPSLEHWTLTAAPFLAAGTGAGPGPQRVRDYRVRRRRQRPG